MACDAGGWQAALAQRYFNRRKVGGSGTSYARPPFARNRAQSKKTGIV
ncbi:hypothetical protein [Burkholderia cenocepacia]|nr:hypothetical protein [Burkholderia cenocepacia]